jgi:TrmH family RNA methyltransferase
MRQLTSLTNPLIKSLVKLQSDSRERRESGLFIVESDRELRRALEQGFEATHVLVEDPQLIEPVVHQKLMIGGAEMLHVTPQIIAKLAYRENPQGLIAVLRSRTTPLEALRFTADSLFVVCSGLEKPGNIGAILRSADAAGVTAVLIDREGFDLFNPNLIRASTGTVFHVPVVCAPPEALITALRNNGVTTLALTPEAKQTYTQANLRRASAIILGAEAEGLSEAWKAAADEQVAIPMRGIADSLNVSVTAAILLFEAVRQRSASR